VSITLFGIPNCDTVKKSRDWLTQQGLTYSFHDYKKSAIDRATLAKWVDALGWEVVLNRAGTTFRKLPDSERSDLDAEKAIGLMLRQPSMIKRPIVEHPGGLLVGFKPEEWSKAFGK
jgi:Spx/MgsR family transcriptional regulator